MFLEKILSLKRQQPTPSQQEIEHWTEQAALLPATRGFAHSLRQGNGPRVIAEFKRASPSKGVLQSGLDPEVQAQKYEQGGASALSILTEPHYFQGSREDLQMARAACSLPVLRKDFLLEDWEIYQSRCWGADAILLIAAALSTKRLGRMLELCRDVGLDALVEVHTEAEARSILPLNPAMIGINNRDLVSFHVDLQVTAQLLPLLPGGSLKIAESGFETNQQLLMFPEVDAFLIGETLVRTEDPVESLKRLRGVQSSAKGR